MAIDYNKMAGVAKRLISENGRALEFVKENQSPSDPTKPWDGPSAQEEVIQLMGVFVPPNTVRQFGLTALGEGTKYEDLVTFSQQIIIVFPEDYDLREYIHIRDRGEKWGIIGLQVLRPAHRQLLAFVGVRR